MSTAFNPDSVRFLNAHAHTQSHTKSIHSRDVGTQWWVRVRVWRSRTCANSCNPNFKKKKINTFSLAGFVQRIKKKWHGFFFAFFSSSSWALLFSLSLSLSLSPIHFLFLWNIITLTVLLMERLVCACVHRCGAARRVFFFSHSSSWVTTYFRVFRFLLYLSFKTL